MLSRGNLRAAVLCDAHRIGNGFGAVSEGLRHFSRAFKEKALRAGMRVSGPAELLSRLDAQKHIPGLRVAGPEVVAVVGGCEGQPQGFS